MQNCLLRRTRIPFSVSVQGKHTLSLSWRVRWLGSGMGTGVLVPKESSGASHCRQTWSIFFLLEWESFCESPKKNVEKIFVLSFGPHELDLVIRLKKKKLLPLNFFLKRPQRKRRSKNISCQWFSCPNFAQSSRKMRLALIWNIFILLLGLPRWRYW